MPDNGKAEIVNGELVLMSPTGGLPGFGRRVLLGTFGGMKYCPDVPIFAAETRSENGYGLKAEQEMAEKRADYFAAGCRVVWDMDLLSADVVRVYRTDIPHLIPHLPRVYRRSGFADAEPAVPGCKMAVDELFE